MGNPPDPSPAFADLFRRRLHSIDDHHRPGSVRFTWNARGALFQLLTALPRPRGSTVLVPAYHCLALTKPIEAAGFAIDCYRVRRDFTIDLEDLASRLHAGVKAVVVIHYFGFPTELDEVLGLVRMHGALLIEDCSHSFLTRDRGAGLGQRGDYAVFSYYKCTPSLVGGALVTNGGAPSPQVPAAGPPWPVQLAVIHRWLQRANSRAPKRLLRLVDRVLRSVASRGFRWHGRGTAPDLRDVGNALPTPGFLDKPYLFNLSLARAGLPAYVRRMIEVSPWDEITRVRRHNYTVWSRLIPDSAVIHRPLPQLPVGVVPFMFPLFFTDRRQHEIALRETAIPYLRFGDTLDPAVEGASEEARADAQYLSGSVMLLPVHQDLNERQIEVYARALLDCVDRLSGLEEDSVCGLARRGPDWSPRYSG